MPAPEAVGMRYSKGVFDVKDTSCSGIRTAFEERYTCAVVPKFHSKSIYLTTRRKYVST